MHPLVEGNLHYNIDIWFNFIFREKMYSLFYGGTGNIVGALEKLMVEKILK